MADVNEELLKIVKSSAYPNDVRIGAAQGLGYSAGAEVRKALVDVAKSSAYPMMSVRQRPKQQAMPPNG